MTTYEKLKTALQAVTALTNVPVFYSLTQKKTEVPYIAYRGNGQNVFEADNTYYWKQNTYIIEYYYTLKNEQIETAIEDALLDSGFLYDKSDDIYIESEDVNVIYYYI